MSIPLYSTSLKNMLLSSKASVTSDNISFTAASSTMGRVSGSMLEEGFRPGDIFQVSGSGSNDGLYSIASLSEDGLTVTLNEAVLDESAGEEITVKHVLGKNLAGLMRYGVMALYSGTPPTTADVALPGTKLAVLTDGGDSFTIGGTTGGIDLTDTAAANGVLQVTTDIEGQGIAEGTAQYAVWFDNLYDETADPAGARIIFSLGTNSGNFQIGAGGRTVEVGSPHKVQSVRLFY